MIDYETYLRIRHLSRERGLSFAQIGRELSIDPETAARYARAECYAPPKRRARRSSKLDAFKALIMAMLERHPYTGVQIFQRLREDHGYEGGESIVRDFVRRVRPPRRPAFLTLSFEPGEAAQADWGCAGTIALGETRRRLSFFVMTLCWSRMLYVEFTAGEALEHFLACHRNALEFFGGVPRRVIIDNLKTGVLSHRFGEKPQFNARYLDFASCCGFAPEACGVRKPHEKGRVENAVGYVKKNFLSGLDLPGSLEALNAAARRWMDSVANVRVHGETGKVPAELHAQEKTALRTLWAMPPDTGVARIVRVTSRCRVVLDTNRYSVPSIHASRRLTLKLFAERLCLYDEGSLVAEHRRCYERRRDFENPDHIRDLLDRRRRARDARLLIAFHALCPAAAEYSRRLEERRLNARLHVARIMALADIYGADPVARAIEDACEFGAFGGEYIANILEQRTRLAPAPGPLHLTRRSDLLELDLGAADLSLYGAAGADPSAESSESPSPPEPSPMQ